MGRVVRFEAPGEVVLADYDDPALGPTEVLLRTLYSGISAGTELTAYRGSNPYLNKRWEPERRLFVEHDVSLEYPVEGWGYEEVGEVAGVGTGVTKVAEGDVVWGTWGHRSTHVMDEADASRRVLPRGVDPIGGVFSQIGAIALNAILDSDIHVGETVAIFGQGVPGLLATQLATLNGGRVVAVDRIARRLALAEELGAARALDATEMGAAEAIKETTEGRGADVAIELSGSYLALHEAIRATAYNGRVVVSGFFQGDARGLYLGEEFHHNRIQLVCSQISGVSPALDHRWDEWRLKSTFMDLVSRGRVQVAPLVSHVLPVDEAARGFELLDRSPAETVQVVLRF
ncbi:MAG TPA: zinc-binding dehydrogenase [Actinomycetota bacterium]|nr:zinc-binding dehydrogenase [Actinomycetota bacterium]